jgi:tRNA 2-thiouridine synthesizing protein A
VTRIETPGITVDGYGLLCVQLLLRLRAQIADVPAGTVVHIITTDPAAPLDLPAWCHLTGHDYLGPVSDQAASRHAIRVTARPQATMPSRPWHLRA